MKTHNEYARLLDPLYAQTPKAVLAAVLVAFVVKDGAELAPSELQQRVIEEWEVLHANGIVPQKGPTA